MSLNVEASTYTTVKVNPAASYNSAGTKYLPAVVKGQSGAVAALETMVLALPATRTGQIAAALAMAGLTYGANKLFEYLAAEGFPIDSETRIPQKTITEYIPIDKAAAEQEIMNHTTTSNNFAPPNYEETIYVTTSQEALQNSLTSPYTQPGGNTFSTMEHWSCLSAWNPTPPIPKPTRLCCYPKTSGLLESQQKQVPAMSADIETAVTTGMNNGEKSADDAVVDTLNRVNESLQNLNDTLRSSPKWSDIQGYLDAEIDQSTKTSLDTKLADPNASSTYASQTTTTNTTTTTNSTTYNTTTNNYYENDGTFAPLSQYNQGTQTTKLAYEQPEVGDFSQLMADFIDTMKNTDLFSLPGLMTSSIPSSGGDCELTINLGQHFGGTKTISFCEWATALSYIKAVLLCLASVVAVGIVCKGGAA